MTLGKKEVIGLLAILVLLAALPVAILLVKTRLEIRPRAAFGEVGLALVPSEGSYALGEEFEVEVKITQEGPTEIPIPTTPIPTPGREEPTATPTPITEQPTPTPTSAPGEPTPTPSNPCQPPNFCVPATQCPENRLVNLPCLEENLVCCALGEPPPPTSTPTSKPGEPTATPTPITESALWVAHAQIPRQPFAISAANMTLNFDASVLEVTNVSIEGTPFTDLVLSDIKNNEGKVKLAAVVKKETAELPSGTMTVAKVTFKGKGEGTSEVTFSDYQIVGYNDQNEDVLLDVDQKLEGSYTIGGVTPDTPWVKFSLKFRGMSEEIKPDLKVKLRVVDVSKYPWEVYDDFEDVEVASDKDGVYRPKDEWVPLPGVTAGSSFNILLKGPKHLRKRVAKGIPLYAGKDKRNVFDGSATPLEPGDVPDPKNDYKQDGVVNGNDASLVLDRFGKSDEEAIRVADLSFDNVVNVHDHSLLIETLWEKYEDEE